MSFVVKFAAILLILLMAPWSASGQTSGQRNLAVVTWNGVPSPTGCTPYVFSLDTSTGDLYDCLNGSWNKIASGSGPAPANAKYITQTPNATLTAEQALSLLATGLLKSTTGTGVISIATAGTDFENPLTFSVPLARATNTISISGVGSTTGGASQVLTQPSLGAPITVTRLTCFDLSDAGSGCRSTVALSSSSVNTLTIAPNKLLQQCNALRTTNCRTVSLK